MSLKWMSVISVPMVLEKGVRGEKDKGVVVCVTTSTVALSVPPVLSAAYIGASAQTNSGELTTYSAHAYRKTCGKRNVSASNDVIPTLQNKKSTPHRFASDAYFGQALNGSVASI